MQSLSNLMESVSAIRNMDEPSRIKPDTRRVIDVAYLVDFAQSHFFPFEGYEYRNGVLPEFGYIICAA